MNKTRHACVQTTANVLIEVTGHQEYLL